MWYARSAARFEAISEIRVAQIALKHITPDVILRNLIKFPTTCLVSRWPLSDVEKSRLENSNLENTDLENTNLENTDLENTDLENTDLENVVYVLLEKPLGSCANSFLCVIHWSCEPLDGLRIPLSVIQNFHSPFLFLATFFF